MINNNDNDNNNNNNNNNDDDDDEGITPRNNKMYSFNIDRNNDYEALNQYEDVYINRHISSSSNNISISNRGNYPWIRIGLLIMVSPFIIAFVTSLYQGGSMFNEGTGTGFYLWFIILTIPIGILIITIALILRAFEYFWRIRR